ncbi:CKLF-like MARVEL transmembrane domain-containing protein 7 isoform X2 [Poecilia latipinna]|uniref:CKLF-like MARVEL transmembrane domain-containing protein 7 isoform X2 n=1 Tax=Poecilia latipinna TaxID=48699 RepID=UPI00072E7A42|nr:PREDICTED: CKLF-like MARVEL transmembrane domain-containing protein 7 isoform X2 [Poecilia latipinna]
MSLTAISSTPSGGRSSGDGGLNLGYSRTIPGLLKIGQLLSLLVAFLCVRLARGWPNWLQVKMPCINWPLAEFFHYSVGSVLIFIASIIAAVKCGAVSSLVVASVFGLIATFLMVVNLWTSYSVACGPAAGEQE